MTISSSNLQELLTAIDDMMRNIMTRDRKAILDTVVLHMHNLLRAETSAVFLTPAKYPNELALEASYTDKYQYFFNPVRFKIQSAVNEGLTSHIVNQGHIVRLYGKELQDNIYSAKRHHEYTIGGRCLSVMVIPLKDRKGHIIGALKCDNKKDKNGVVSANVHFNESDEAIARILADQVTVVLENLRTSEGLREIINGIKAVEGVNEVFDIVLEQVLYLLHADIGDLALWKPSEKELINWFKLRNNALRIGRPLPSPDIRPSIIYDVWEKGMPVNYGDVSSVRHYLPADIRTRSEAAIRLEWQGRPFGVLNIESFEPNGFDSQDMEMLTFIAQYAAVAVGAAGDGPFTQGVFRRIRSSVPPQKETLDSVLESVRDIFHFDAGLIYTADQEKKELRCSNHMGCDNLEVDPKQICKYTIHDHAIATKIYRTGIGSFIPDPPNDPDVDLNSIRELDIKNPLVGVPLIYKKKVVGVLVVWSRREILGDIAYIDHLKPLARLAAELVVLSASQQRSENFLDEVRKILTSINTPQLRKLKFNSILYAVQMIGFDRVRIYEYDYESSSFIGLASVGMARPTEFINCTINIKDNPYAAETVANASENPIARKYDPLDPTMFGADPHNKILDKPNELPWAVAPLLVGNKLLGQITADNIESQRHITSDYLAYLTLIASLATQVISSDKTIHDLQKQSDFVRGIIHDLNGPTLYASRFLVALMNQIKAAGSESPAISDLGDNIERQIHRIAITSQRLNFLSHSNSERKDISLNATLTTIISDSKTDSNAYIEWNLCPTSPIVSVYTDEFDRAIIELAKNAWGAIYRRGVPGHLVVTTEFCNREQHTELRSKSHEKYICISMMDNGCGVPRSLHNTLFEPGVHSGEGSGSGIGLRNVKDIAAMHNGAVWLADTSQSGSMFVFALPIIKRDLI